MSTYTITAVPSGKDKDNNATRNLSTVFPYSAGQYRTISSITRKNGLWCNCGGASQSVVLEGYDQIINTSTGAVIKTSGNATCKIYGTGPSGSNYMTTSFTGWTQAESNAAVAAWAAGKLQIKRTVWIKSYTSSNHGQPTFRDGYYDDTITIQGSTVPFTDYRPAISTFTLMRSNDGLTEDQLSSSVYAKIQLSMNNTAGLDAGAKLILAYSLDAEFASGVTMLTLASGRTQLTPYFNLSVTKISGTFSVGSTYYFRLVFSAGEEVSTPKDASVSMAYTPIHIPKTNAGIAFGMYSNATASDRRCEINYPIYAYEDFKRIGDGWTNLTPLTGSTPGEYGGGVLRCRAIEDKRIIDGSMLVKAGADTIVLANLPSGYTPKKGVFSLNACSGARVARIAVGGTGETNAGKLALSWIKNLSDGSNYTAEAIWVQCSIEYWVN